MHSKTAQEASGFWHEQGWALLDDGDFDGACEAFSHAIRMDPGNAVYLADKGLACFECRRYDEAGRLLEKALRLDPSLPVACLRMGNLFKVFGDLGQAAAAYSAAIDRNARYGEAYNNRGSIHEALGDSQSARGDYERAIAVKPVLVEPYLNLGRLHDAAGDYDAAVAVYRGALDQGLDTGLFSHLTDALLLKNPVKAPPGYVRAIFNDAAFYFDKHLIQTLGYKLPERIAQIVRTSAGDAAGIQTCVDLGCGTGLCGAALDRPFAHLTGVDLSARMLAQAELRDIYDDLVEADIETFLCAAPAQSLDFALAADVLIYVGALDALFAGVARALKAGGHFIFSIESLPAGASFQLQRAARYRHASEYIHGLLNQHGLGLVAEETLALRLERGEPVPGVLFTAVKNA